MHIGESRGAPVWGKPMFRSTQLRFAAIVLFAVATVSLTAASAWAFSQGNGGTGEGGNSAFADPDEQVNIFGFGFDQGPQPSGLNGSVQVGPQQGQLTPFKHFQINSLTSPPDPLSRPSN
jgi:hypothetical protein